MIDIPEGLRHSNTWLPIDDAVCGGLGGVTLWEDLHHYGWALRLKTWSPFQFTFSLLGDLG